MKVLTLHLLVALMATTFIGCTQQSPDTTNTPSADEDEVAILELREDEGETNLIPALIDGLSSDNVDVRESCSERLVEIAPKRHDVVDALMNTALQDQDPVVKKHAAEALGAIGPFAKAAVPALDQLQRDPVEPDDVRKAATHALELINKVES